MLIAFYAMENIAKESKYIINHGMQFLNLPLCL